MNSLSDLLVVIRQDHYDRKSFHCSFGFRVLVTVITAHRCEGKKKFLRVRNSELIAFDDLIALNQFGSCKKNLPTYTSSPLLVNDEHRDRVDETK
jgi:hypothetical protein